ncbi:ATP-binding protein [Melioribacteraceae bacterium 4301-Me]|uniref:ATP-binding protein n=1 Tax=Pyranulibacter aquaticus TaxID=3163344 RepID=UPI00359594B4
MEIKKIKIVSDYDLIGEVNQQVKNFLQFNDVENFICSQIEISLTEALNNVIKHAYNNDNSKPIEISVSKDAKEIIIKIVDEGVPRENLEIPKLEFDPNDIPNLPESGMGLYIISQLMDEIDYQTLHGKNIFTLKKKLY